MANDIVPVNKAQGAVSALSAGLSNIYCSFALDSQESKVRALDALTNAEPVGDHLDETINLRDVMVQATTMVDEATGEERDALRTILIADDGSAYAAMSDGLFKALQNFFGILGQPATWVEPLPVKVVEVKGRKGFKFFTIKIA